MFSVLPVHLESASKNGCYAALVTVPVLMTKHLRESAVEKGVAWVHGSIDSGQFLHFQTHCEAEHHGGRI